MSAYLQSKLCQKHLNSLGTGTTIQHLRKKDIEKLEIFIPPAELQQQAAFAFYADGIDVVEYLRRVAPSIESDVVRSILDSGEFQYEYISDVLGDYKYDLSQKQEVRFPLNVEPDFEYLAQLNADDLNFRDNIKPLIHLLSDISKNPFPVRLCECCQFPYWGDEILLFKKWESTVARELRQRDQLVFASYDGAIMNSDDGSTAAQHIGMIKKYHVITSKMLDNIDTNIHIYNYITQTTCL